MSDPQRKRKHTRPVAQIPLEKTDNVVYGNEGIATQLFALNMARLPDLAEEYSLDFDLEL